MKLSVEISLYPLQDEYKEIIKEFLDVINQHRGESIEVRTSNMSTRIFGDFTHVNELITKAMELSMQRHGKMVFVCKYLQGDARDLEGYD